MVKSGIYKIVNEVTGKCYVGSSVEIDRRWNQHKNLLTKDKHHSTKLQNSVNKHGFDSFVFEVIEECDSSILMEREQHWLDLLNVVDDGYNINYKADGRSGVKLSEEHKKRISDSRVGNSRNGIKHSDETKQKMSESGKNRDYSHLVGIPRNNETKKKISNTLKGRTFSDETKQKMSESAKNRKKKSN
jgi:group I intron endonuclease